MACTSDMTFEECELAILRENVDKAEKKQGQKLLHSPATQSIIKIVESFIHKNGLIIYGGTAINNILPKNDRFYDYSYQLPDYDVYSTDAVGDAKKLADVFRNTFNKKEDSIEAKAGVHFGTYKVYVNNLAVADITYLQEDLFQSLKKDIIRKQGLLIKKDLLYAPANFLRQSMYLELSRPNGDISRWEKVLKRLTLLNKHYPLKIKKCKIKIQRKMSDMSVQNEKKIFNIVKKCFVQEKLVFIGGYANALYSKYSPINIVKSLPDFDVLSTQPLKTCENVKSQLEKEGFHCSIKTYPPIGELIEEHYSIQIGEDYIAFVYKPNACHSFNEVTIDGDKIKVGTIDTLLSFYMAFMYADREYHDINRLVCLSTMLFNIQQQNRLKQSGLLQRFNINCYGEQKTLSDIRDEKLKMRTELNPKSGEYEKWFLNYDPSNKTKQKKQRKQQTKKKLNKKK